MKTILFIGTQKSGSSRDAIKAAEGLGYYTVLFTDRPSFIKKCTKFTDVQLMQLHNLRNNEALKQAIRLLISDGLDIHAIVSFVDAHCYTASLLAEEFGLIYFTSEAIYKMQDKILSRQALSNSIYNPHFTSLSSNASVPREKVERRLPLIVKAPNSAGSRDVYEVTTYEGFNACVRRLSAKYPKQRILIEEFLDGPQYLVETVVYKEQLYIVAVVEQEVTFTNGHFIITGYNLLIDPPASIYESLRFAVESILKDFGMKSGPSHLEMRYINDQWKLIEINPRISGGGMNQLLFIGLGINLVEETLKISLGQEPNFEPRHKVHTFAQYIIIPEPGELVKVTGRSSASECPGVKAVYVKVRKGRLLEPPVSMGDRYAYVIATGESEQNARENAKHAASQINFNLAPQQEEKQEPANSNTKEQIT